jgi:hypothetical protein
MVAPEYAILAGAAVLADLLGVLGAHEADPTANSVHTGSKREETKLRIFMNAFQCMCNETRLLIEHDHLSVRWKIPW